MNHFRAKKRKQIDSISTHSKMSVTRYIYMSICCFGQKRKLSSAYFRQTESTCILTQSGGGGRNDRHFLDGHQQLAIVRIAKYVDTVTLKRPRSRWSISHTGRAGSGQHRRQTTENETNGRRTSSRDINTATRTTDTDTTTVLYAD